MAGTAFWMTSLPLFDDRVDAGRQLASELDRRGLRDCVVIGLARGGVQVAAEIARRLHAPLDVLAVRKVGHPWQPEYALGAVTPGEGGVYVRGPDGLTEDELEAVVADAQRRADELDRVFHSTRPAEDLAGRTALLVDDGLATGATMIAACRWARARGAARVLVVVPVAAVQSLPAIRSEADEVVCPYELEDFVAVGLWYRSFEQVEDGEVIELLEKKAP